MRRATDEDIKKIKKGDTFLVDLKHDGNVNEFWASRDAHYNGRRWCVDVETTTIDARTGRHIVCGGASFDDCYIVINE